MTIRRAALALALCVSPLSAVAAPEKVTIAHFLGWPTPLEYGRVTGAYEAAMGVEVEWVVVETGTEMSALIAEGAAQIVYSQGAPPFVVGVASGLPLRIVEISLSYSGNNNCVIREGLGVSKDDTAALNGASVALPIGTAAHYGFLRQMEHFGVDVATMSIVNLTPDAAAAAFAEGEYDMVCGYGAALRDMELHGKVLLTAEEKQALGIYVFDVTAIPAEFAETHPEIVQAFIDTTTRLNADWAARPDEMFATIAEASEMTPESARLTMEAFTFLTVEEQLSEEWLGGGALDYLHEVAAFFVAQGQIMDVPPDFAATVDTRFLEAARTE